ncbi:MAG: tetratricopeptide repeat protein [Candidatus Omnitrophica bacterium]|nr:tetratricopeptide repeat protein [Candidatus Omnitrophota bacterium]
MNRATVFSIILIVALGFVVYGNSLKGEFVWDDEHLIEKNVYIRSFSHLGDIFSKDISGVEGKYGFYRPLQLLSYMFDYAIWKFNVFGYHLTNIILHILVALALFYLLNILFKNMFLSLSCSILFLVHPIHTEAVSYISGRSDTLGLLFMLLSLAFYLKNINTGKNSFFLLMLIAYTLALLSREIVLILPILLLIYHYSFKVEIKKKSFGFLVVVSLFYIALRLTLLRFLIEKVSFSTTFLQRVPGFFKALANYIKLLFLPLDLHMEYGNRVFNITDPAALAGIFIFVLLTGISLKAKRTKTVVFFAIMWFFIGLIPSSNLYPINAYMAEHWLYLPSIGFFLLMAIGLDSLYSVKKRRATAITMLGLLLILYSSLTIIQNTFWREPISFYKRTLSYVPDSSRAHYNLGNEYKEREKHKEALSAYNEAIKLKPDYPSAYNNIGTIYQAQGKEKQAIAAYKKAIELGPEVSEGFYNLAIVYDNSQRYAQAIEYYKKAIQVDADFVQAYNNLGLVYAKSNDEDKARQCYKKALQIDPGHANAYFNLGNLDFNNKDYEKAIGFYKKALAINPRFAKAYSNLGSVYEAQGKEKQAIAAYERALELDPEITEAHYNLGLIYTHRSPQEAIAAYKNVLESDSQNADAHNKLCSIYLSQTKYQEAIFHCKKALEIKPDYIEACYNLGMLYDIAEKDQEAINAYQMVIQLRPDLEIAYNNLGNIYLRTGQVDKAIATYKKGIELNVRFAEGYGNLAVAYYRAGKYDLAVEAYKKAKELGFNNPSLAEVLKPYIKDE